MSVDSAQETKIDKFGAMQTYLGDQLGLGHHLGVFALKFKWAYPNPDDLWKVFHLENPAMETLDRSKCAHAFTRLLEKLGSPNAPYSVVGAIVRLKLSDGIHRDLMSFLLEVGFEARCCVVPNVVTMVSDFTLSAEWQRGDEPHQLPSPPHTTVSGFAIIFNKNKQFVVIKEDAFDPATNTIKQRYGLVGGRKNPGQGAHFLGEPGGEIELETGLKGVDYWGTLQQKMTVADDMYGGDTIVSIDIYGAGVEDVPLSSTSARQNAVPMWIEKDQFLAFLTEKEGADLAKAAIRKAEMCIYDRSVKQYEHSVNSKGKPRWTLKLHE